MENASLQPSGVNETPDDNLGHQRDLLTGLYPGCCQRRVRSGQKIESMYVVKDGRTAGKKLGDVEERL